MQADTLENFQVGYVRALAKCGRPLEEAFLKAVGATLAVKAEKLWQEERERTETLKKSQPTTAPFRVRASMRGQNAIAAMIGSM